VGSKLSRKERNCASALEHSVLSVKGKPGKGRVKNKEFRISRTKDLHLNR